jgi:hypothetical protein
MNERNGFEAEYYSPYKFCRNSISQIKSVLPFFIVKMITCRAHKFNFQMYLKNIEWKNILLSKESHDFVVG